MTKMTKPASKKTTHDLVENHIRSLNDEARAAASSFFETPTPTFEMVMGIYQYVFLAFGEWDAELSEGQLEVLTDLEIARKILQERLKVAAPTPSDIFAFYREVLDNEDE